MKTKSTLLVLACAGLALSACTAYTPPAHRINYTDQVRAGESYTVKRGENLYAVAQKHGVRVHQLVKLNKMRPPYYLRPGTRIVIPAKGPATTMHAVQTSSLSYAEEQSYLNPANREWAGSNEVSSTPLEPVQLAPQKYQASTDVTSSSVIAKTIKPSIEIYDPPAVKKLAEPKTYPSNKEPTFGWPVRGTIISTYGPKGKGRDNDGINIGAPKGSPVKASEAGTIVYAGNGMKGFGNLVLIKHSKGWVTAYAHMNRLTVKKNESVEKGAMIGNIGSTGGVSSPQLHFEARRDGIPVDPELVIK